MLMNNSASAPRSPGKTNRLSRIVWGGPGRQPEGWLYPVYAKSKLLQSPAPTRQPHSPPLTGPRFATGRTPKNRNQETRFVQSHQGTPPLLTACLGLRKLTMRFSLLLTRRRRCRALRRRTGLSWGPAGSLRLGVGRRRRSQLLHIRRNNTFHRRHPLHLAGFGIGKINAELGKRFRGGLIQCHPGFFVVGSSIENVRLGFGQIAGRLQHQRRGRSAIAKLLLLRHQALLLKIAVRPVSYTHLRAH